MGVPNLSRFANIREIIICGCIGYFVCTLLQAWVCNELVHMDFEKEISDKKRKINVYIF
jgi:hypothetical protein